MFLEGKDVDNSENLKDLSVGDIVCYKYVGLVSCDLERKFSQCKSLFHYKRHRLTIHNLKMTFAVHCNSASLSV
jgi:hypothetical protein